MASTLRGPCFLGLPVSCELRLDWRRLPASRLDLLARGHRMPTKEGMAWGRRSDLRLLDSSAYLPRCPADWPGRSGRLALLAASISRRVTLAHGRRRPVGRGRIGDHESPNPRGG